MKRKPFIAALIITLMLTLMICAPVSAASAKSKAVKAYKEFLAQKEIETMWSQYSATGKFATKNMKFALIYFDKNSVPELLIDNRKNSPLKEDFMIFTYKKGKVVEVYYTRFVNGIKAYYPKKNILVFDQTGYELNEAGEVVSEYKATNYVKYKFGGGDEEIIAQKTGGKYFKYEIVKEERVRSEISKTEFKNRLKNKVGSTSSKKVKFYKNTKKNRKNYLK